MTAKEHTNIINEKQLNKGIIMSDITSVGRLVEEKASKQPNKEALINHDGTIRYSYAELSSMIDNLAKALIELGLKKGDKVAIWSKNSIEWIIAQIGISKAGCVMVAVNPHERMQIIEYLIKNSDAAAMVMMEGIHGTENIDMLFEMCPELSTCDKNSLSLKKFPFLKSIIMVGNKAYPGLLAWEEVLKMGSMCTGEKLAARSAEIAWEDAVHMIYTSGTTGMPKGVPLSNRNVILNAKAMSIKMGIKPDYKFCLQPPLFHTFGCIACVIVAYLNGCTILIMDKFVPEKTLKMIEKEKCDVLSGVPTMFLSFLKEFEKGSYDTSTLKTGIIAGAASPKGLIEDIIEQMGIKGIIHAYGLTETSPCISASNWDDPTEAKENTVGRLIPELELRLVDDGTGKDVASGEKGEICVRGDTVMNGYYKMPEETAKTIDKDGWLHSGDIGYIREDGCLVLASRIKDIIIRGGENIYPAEIENIIIEHPAVEDIYAVGVPDDVKGEEIMAFIKLKDNASLTEAEVKEFCRDKLATHKIPRYINFVSSFPVSSTGKVLKRELRSIGAELIKSK